jgi:hypothetical protein
MNASSKSLFEERDKFDSVADCTPLTMAPGLGAVLNDDSPPPFSYFLSLPAPIKDVWGVYAKWMEKPGSRPAVYSGSGTAEGGLKIRIDSYKPTSVNLPLIVNRYLKRGYRFSHVGMLCWTPKPRPALIPRARGFFLALEAGFTVALHCCIPKITDAYTVHLHLWARDAVAYDPLYSHLSLEETIRRNLNMSSEELELAAVLRKGRTNSQTRGYRAALREIDPVGYIQARSQSHREWRARQCKIDPVGYAKSRAKQRHKQMLKRHKIDASDLVDAGVENYRQYRAKQRKNKLLDQAKANVNNRALCSDATLETARKVHNKAKEEKRFFCKDCNLPTPISSPSTSI